MQLDPHRQESQRDFGDPIGCAARVLIEGLWGVRPDLPHAKLSLRPQLPLEWEKAALAHPELQIEYACEERRGEVHDSWHVTQTFRPDLKLSLELRARSVEPPTVLVNGHPVQAQFVQRAVGEPRLELRNIAASTTWRVEIAWPASKPVVHSAEPLRCTVGAPVVWPAQLQSAQVNDPQGWLQSGRAARAGSGLVFLLQQHGACEYWLPVALEVEAGTSQRPTGMASAGKHFEPVPLAQLLTGNAREILTREYLAPRPGLCSLNLPTGLLGGWADFDAKAYINDDGMRKAGGMLSIAGGLHFQIAAGSAANCCFLSQWSLDRAQTRLPLQGRALRLHLLLVGTTFPQATRSVHATVTVTYTEGPTTIAELASPHSWWPVEQDYMVDDYVFRMSDPEGSFVKVPWRVDLQKAEVRPTAPLRRPGTPGGNVPGGAAFVVSVELDANRALTAVELHVPIYGVVLGWMGATLERR